MLTVHLKTDVPSARLLTAQWFEVELAKVAEAPLKRVQTPCPTVGTTASRVPDPLHEILDTPPSAERLLLVIYISELLLQLPFVTVHVNLLLPDESPLTEVLADDGELTDAEPMLVHKPLPTDGTVAVSTAVEEQTLWLDPASDVDGELLVTLTSENAGQAPLVTLHRNTLSPKPSPDTTTE